jgi:hypothetical protein
MDIEESSILVPHVDEAYEDVSHIKEANVFVPYVKETCGEVIEGNRFSILRGTRSPLSWGILEPTLTIVILEEALRWKKTRMCLASDSDVKMVPSLSRTPTLTSPLLMLTGSSSQGPYLMGMEDVFSKLNLGYAPLHFPNLSEEEINTMGSFFQESSTLGHRGVEVMDALDKVLILPCSINGLTDPNYQCHLAIIRHMAFQV